MRLPFRIVRECGHGCRKPHRRRALHFDILEDRLVPTVSSVFSGGLLTITTDSPASIAVTQSSLGVKVNGADPDSGFALAATVTGISITGSSGNDTFDLTGLGLLNFPLLVGTTLNGGAGDDTYIFDGDGLANLGGLDVFDSDGNDTFDFSATASQGINLDLSLSGTVQDVLAGVPNFTILINSSAVIENAIGGGGADILFGNSENNYFEGGDGADSIDAGGGDDTLIGGGGNDTLAGNLGADIYRFDADSSLGSDTLVDTDTHDMLDFSQTTTAGITLDLSQSGAQVLNANLTLTLGAGLAFNSLYGTELGDTITGNTNGNYIESLGGADLLTGGDGGDTLNGGSGNDTIIGGLGNDYLSGSDGDDSLAGGADDDTYCFDFDADAGTDIVNENAGAGFDTLNFQDTTTASIASFSLASTSVQDLDAANHYLYVQLTDGAAIESAIGTGLNDSITGNSLDNSITGGKGDDTLFGLFGDDTLVGDDHYDPLTGGNDSLDGGDGNDWFCFNADIVGLGVDTITDTLGTNTLCYDISTVAVNVVLGLLFDPGGMVANANHTLHATVGTLINVVRGGGGNDTIVGTSSADTLYGLSGNDNIDGGAGADSLDGDYGNDTLYGGNDNDYITGSDGDDSIDGGDGNDDLWGYIGNDAIAGGIGNDTIHGGDDNDTLTGGNDADSLYGENGADSLQGGLGDDSLGGGDQNDTLEGGAGNDTLIGEANDDTYLFDADTALGSDYIEETVSGGNDSFDFSATSTGLSVDLSSIAAQVVNGNLTITLSNNDTFENVAGGSGNDAFYGNIANNYFAGGSGSDFYAFIADSAQGDDTVSDSSGIDVIDFGSTTAAVTLNLSLATQQAINANMNLTLSSGNAFEKARGGSGSDTLTGNDLNNTIYGGAGADTIDGGNGNDRLEGQVGSDSLVGGAGDDTYAFIYAGVALGTDTLNDASGTDTLDFSTNSFSVNVNLATAVTQFAVLGSGLLNLNLSSATALENVIGSDVNDNIVGNALANSLTGGLGDDTLVGNDGSDTLSGDDGDDSLLGGFGADSLFGGNDDDTLSGDDGSDNLDGGAGNDAYSFILENQLGVDTLTDASGVDALDFSATTTYAVLLNLTVDVTQIVSSTLSLNLGSSLYDKVFGGAQNDVITGDSFANTLVGGAGNDSLDGGAGNDALYGDDLAGIETGEDSLIGGSGDDSLLGGRGNDQYIFDADSNVGSDQIDETSGNDTLDFSRTSTAGININLGLYSTTQLVSGNLTLAINAGADLDNVIGTSLADTIVGNALNNSLVGGGGTDIISGGGGVDSIVSGSNLDEAPGDDYANTRPGAVLQNNDITAFAGRAVAAAGVIASSQDADVFFFDMNGPLLSPPVFVEMWVDPTGPLDSLLVVRDSAGNLVSSNDDISSSNHGSKVSFLAYPGSGQRYFVEVRGVGASVGGYVVRYQFTSPEDGVLLVGGDIGNDIAHAATLSDDLEDGDVASTLGRIDNAADVDYYRINVDHAGHIFLAMSNADEFQSPTKRSLNTFLRVFDQNGQLLASNASLSDIDGVLAVNVATAQTIYVEASSYHTLFGGGMDDFSDTVGIYKLVAATAPTLVDPSGSTLDIDAASILGPQANRQMIEALLGIGPTTGTMISANGITIDLSTVHYAGAGASAGVFDTNGTDDVFTDLRSGIVLSTGDVSDIAGDNDDLISSNMGTGGSGILTDASGLNTYDSASFSFDFTSTVNSVSFQFVFASEEFGDYAFSPFSDVFGLYINGVNYARVPGTENYVAGSGAVVSIQTINLSEHPELYLDNNINQQLAAFGGERGTEQLRMDGWVKVITVHAPVRTDGVNHIEFVVADAVDRYEDSALFIRGLTTANESFTTGVDSALRADAADSLAGALSTIIADANNQGLVGEGFSQFVQQTVISNVLKGEYLDFVGDYFVFQFDPVDFVLIGPDGKTIDPNDSTSVAAVNGFYKTPDNGITELLIVPNATPGKYQLQLTGVGGGDFNLGGAYVQANGVTTSILIQGKLQGSTVASLDFGNLNGSTTYISLFNAPPPFREIIGVGFTGGVPTIGFLAGLTGNATGFLGSFAANTVSFTSFFTNENIAGSTSGGEGNAEAIDLGRRDSAGSANLIDKVYEVLDDFFSGQKLLETLHLDALLGDVLNGTNTSLPAGISEVGEIFLQTFFPSVSAQKAWLEYLPKPAAANTAQPIQKAAEPTKPADSVRIEDADTQPQTSTFDANFGDLAADLPVDSDSRRSNGAVAAACFTGIAGLGLSRRFPRRRHLAHRNKARKS